MPEHPLAGVRILDLSGMLAGPYATRLLADMGAETLKIESLRRYDLTRGAPGGGAGGRVYPSGDPAGVKAINRSSYYNEMNRNKLGVTLDLQTDEGKELFLRLVAVSDVVLENFSAGVLARLGLGYEVLRQHNPKIIVVSMPAFGNDGPWARAVAYGNTIEMLSGLAALNGYPDAVPMTTSFTYGDPVAGVHAAFGLLAALEHRDHAGAGQTVEVVQLEALVQFLGDAILRHQFEGGQPEREGNGDPACAPHGIYRTEGAGGWVAIAVTQDSEWEALCRAMGRPELAGAPEFAAPVTRWEHRGELDAIVGEWTAGRTAAEVVEALQAVGVPSAPVLNAETISRDPQFAARSYLEEVEHPEAGTHRYPGLPWRMSGIGEAIRRPAPLLGEHTGEVLTRILDVPDSELEDLAAKRVIGSARDL